MRPAVKTVLYGRNSLDDYVRAGLAYVVNPTTDTGYFSYLNGSRLALPAATNYCTNPSFEIDSNADGVADGWTIIESCAGTPTYSRVGALCGSGSYAQRIQYTGAGDTGKYIEIVFERSAVGSFVNGDSCTISFTVKGSIVGTSTPAFYIAFQNAAGTDLTGGYVAVTPSATPVRYSKTLAATHADTSRMQIQGWITDIDTGDTIDITIDDVLIEKSSILTPYGDGSYPGWAWAGTPNASLSNRTVSALTSPIALNAAGFTIAGRFSPLWAANNSLAHNLLTLYAGADARATVYKHTDNKVYASLTDGSDTVTSASAAQTFAAGTVNCFVARGTWASTVDLNLNGTDATQGDASAVGAQSLTSVALGAAGQYEGPLLFSPVNTPAAYVTAQQATSGALYSDVVGMVKLARRYSLQPFLLLPLAADSVGYVVTG